MKIEVGQKWVFNETGLESEIISINETADGIEVKFFYEGAYYIVDEDYLINTHTLTDPQGQNQSR